jgi:hypothetical protein
MLIGVLCECSGRIRDACIKLGHDAISCDLQPTFAPGPHIQGDVLSQDWSKFDLLVCHPPCTYLCNSGVQWLSKRPRRQRQLENGAKFFRELWELPVAKLAVENPIMHKYAKALIGKLPKPQIVQPWWFGAAYSKATCFWTRGLPKLRPTNLVEVNREQVKKRELALIRHPKRSHIRSITFPGIAKAIAEQWAGYTRRGLYSE